MLNLLLHPKKVLNCGFAVTKEHNYILNPRTTCFTGFNTMSRIFGKEKSTILEKANKNEQAASYAISKMQATNIKSVVPTIRYQDRKLSTNTLSSNI